MPSQAQKHVTHNEALGVLDAVVQLSVLRADLAVPPPTPAEGERHIVAAGASGAWQGWDLGIASFADGGWARLAPKPGWLCYVEAEGGLVAWNGAAWVQLTGSGEAAFNRVGVNTAADGANRLAVKSDGVLFSHDDVTPGSGDMRVALNKASAARTASFVFQSDWSGRAEFGLTGSDDFALKVSANGANWLNALTVARAGGDVTMAGALSAGGRVRVGGPAGSQQNSSPLFVSGPADAAYSTVLSTYSVTANAAAGIGFRVSNGANEEQNVKGAIIFERLLTAGRGSIHLATNNDTSAGPSATIADARLTVTAAGDVGIGTASPQALLHVNGSLAKASGSFDIPHPDPEMAATHRLRHCFVESPTRGDNLYRFRVEAGAAGETVTLPLPAYWRHLNEDAQLWAQAAGHFGRAHGAVAADGTQLSLTCEEPGPYDVLLVATRKDRAARDWFDAKGVEYEVHAPAVREGAEDDQSILQSDGIA
jgi:hypothetical protein